MTVVKGPVPEEFWDGEGVADGTEVAGVGGIVIPGDVCAGDGGGVELKNVCSELPIGKLVLMSVGIEGANDGLGRNIDKDDGSREAVTRAVLILSMSEPPEDTASPAVFVRKVPSSNSCRACSRLCLWCDRFCLTCSTICNLSRIGRRGISPSCTPPPCSP